MVGDTEFLDGFRTVLTDKLLCFDAVILEELAHGIEVLHRHDIVLRIVEEHHVGKISPGMLSVIQARGRVDFAIQS